MLDTTKKPVIVARRQEQLFRNTTSTCYMILYCLFYLIIRSQQTQCSRQIESSYKAVWEVQKDSQPS